jgi:hypothetical protein
MAVAKPADQSLEADRIPTEREALGRSANPTPAAATTHGRAERDSTLYGKSKEYSQRRGTPLHPSKQDDFALC